MNDFKFQVEDLFNQEKFVESGTTDMNNDVEYGKSPQIFENASETQNSQYDNCFQNLKNCEVRKGNNNIDMNFQEREIKPHPPRINHPYNHSPYGHQHYDGYLSYGYRQHYGALRYQQHYGYYPNQKRVHNFVSRQGQMGEYQGNRYNSFANNKMGQSRRSSCTDIPIIQRNSCPAKKIQRKTWRKKQIVEQTFCCVKNCNNNCSNRTRFCLKCNPEFKIDFISKEKDKICDQCYFKDRYKYKKNTVNTVTQVQYNDQYNGPYIPTRTPPIFYGPRYVPYGS